jgi:hypothetical protein
VAAYQKRQITREDYGEFDAAYGWFNEKLFGGTLPPCLITLQRWGFVFFSERRGKYSCF